ncbi:MAG: hypothetical protein QXP29_07350 [Candidatus Nezhaarchaeales archaeon]
MKYKVTFREVVASPLEDKLLRNKQLITVIEADSLEEAREEAERRIKEVDRVFGGYVYLYVEDISPIHE